MKRTALAFVLFLFGCTTVTKPVKDTVRGVAVMPDGSTLPGVTVTLHTPTRDLICITDADGRYEFKGVRRGAYHMDAELAGFSVAHLVVDTRKSAERSVAITLSTSVAETITVTGGAPGIAFVAPVHPLKENGYVAAAKQGTTTFSIDVDGASYALVRRFLAEKELPEPDMVRIEEMVNYFTYDYPPPADGRPLAVAAEVAGCPWAPEHRLLRVGLQAKRVDDWKLASNNLVFLLDVSGSMEGPDRLQLVQAALRLLVDQLRPTDTVSIVVYAGAAGLVLPPTPAASKDVILEALNKLQAGGSTAGGEGIELAYKVAAEHFVRGGNNRVILATDGDFNVGPTSDDELTALIEEKRKSGVYLTCVGVGDDNLQDGIIEMLADKGNGNYYYLDTLDEAKKIFAEQLTGTLVSVADDVKVQIAFNPARVQSYRQIGYENRALENKDFEDDVKDAGELGSGQSVTALYEIVPTPNSSPGALAEIRVRYKDPGAWRSQTLVTAATDEGKSAYDASPDTQFAAAVAEFGMLLRGSEHKGSATYDDVTALARAMRGSDPRGYREELIRLVEQSRALAEKSMASK